MGIKKDKKNNMVLEVAKWEFMRWFKLKEQIITLCVGAAISLLFFGGQYLLEKSSNKEIKIAVINNSKMQLTAEEKSNINLLYAEAGKMDSLKLLLNEKEIDAIIRIHQIDSAEIIVAKEPKWLNSVTIMLNKARERIKIEESNISTHQLNDIFKKVEIMINYSGSNTVKSGTGEKISAGVFLGIMLIGVFAGLAYHFVAITGEKQLRITEVIVSAISPQTWIDGKILGISFLSLVMVFTYSITTIIFLVLSHLFGDGWSIPITITDPVLVIALFLFSLAGFLFWNTFFSAIAATINDPNTSARGSLMMAPVVPVVIAFFALGNPDSLVMRILSFFPLTSAPVMSVRMVLTEISIVEVVISFLLLALTTAYIRKLAGKVFEFSILMYGKEPSWKEMFKALSE